ncbi:MAG TPA: type III-B CRISPR module RAMP protein Cmr1, partial [Thermoanaerobaculia bacterium]|nr:type III-B CRISPR module RAMP protein Cmr1 [Thermoanaerobaculia bacterium]
MQRETFQLEFVTPCFLAGAEGSTEWRAASIRGQLRWWFRAVAGGCWGGDLDRVRREEARLFGSTERKSLLQVQALNAPDSTKASFERPCNATKLARLWGDERDETIGRLKIMHDGREVNSNPINYLAFGPIVFKDRQLIIRPYFPAKSEATIKLLWGAGIVDEETRKVFSKALWAWLNLGGVGAKSRKGFGSLRCKEPNKMYRGPESREEFLAEVKVLLREAREYTAIPAWTHFSSRSRILLATRAAGSWEEAMEWLGAWLIGFRRRYGFPGDSRTLGKAALKNRDYEWAAPNGHHARENVPDRAGFGLPLPFRKKKDGETVIWGLEG